MSDKITTPNELLAVMRLSSPRTKARMVGVSMRQQTDEISYHLGKNGMQHGLHGEYVPIRDKADG